VCEASAQPMYYHLKLRQFVSANGNHWSLRYCQAVGLRVFIP
jgi:hypothetical protein